MTFTRIAASVVVFSVLFWLLSCAPGPVRYLGSLLPAFVFLLPYRIRIRRRASIPKTG